jgi:hypothetical protein
LLNQNSELKLTTAQQSKLVSGGCFFKPKRHILANFARETLAQWGTIRPAATLLEKPFSAETLLQRVRKALDPVPVA